MFLLFRTLISLQKADNWSHMISESVVRDKWPLDSLSEINCPSSLSEFNNNSFAPSVTEPETPGLQIWCCTYWAYGIWGVMNDAEEEIVEVQTFLVLNKEVMKLIYQTKYKYLSYLCKFLKIQPGLDDHQVCKFQDESL